jgi:6-phosphogluconolactonase
VFQRRGDDFLADALFCKDTLAPGAGRNARQIAGAVHVHPGGRFVYCANRGGASKDTQVENLDGGPVNGITVFSIDDETGEPSPIQYVSSGGLSPRTFCLDPAGKALIVGNEGGAPSHAGGEGGAGSSLAVFRISEAGTLTLAHKFEMPDRPSEKLLWVGAVGLG